MDRFDTTKALLLIKHGFEFDQRVIYSFRRRLEKDDQTLEAMNFLLVSTEEAIRNCDVAIAQLEGQAL